MLLVCTDLSFCWLCTCCSMSSDCQTIIAIKFREGLFVLSLEFSLMIYLQLGCNAIRVWSGVVPQPYNDGVVCRSSEQNRSMLP